MTKIEFLEMTIEVKATEINSRINFELNDKMQFECRLLQREIAELKERIEYHKAKRSI